MPLYADLTSSQLSSSLYGAHPENGHMKTLRKVFLYTLEKIKMARQQSSIKYRIISNHNPSATWTNYFRRSTFNVQENTDTFHRIVEESKERRQRDMENKDQWREDLEPRAAIAAWTIPKLEEENSRLREMLYQTETENNTLASQLQERVQGTGDSEEKALRLLKKLDKVGSYSYHSSPIHMS